MLCMLSFCLYMTVMMHSKFQKQLPSALHTTTKALACAGLLVGVIGTSVAQAQQYPTTPQQRQIARSTAARGVPISELAPNAPSKYVVKTGDTLWGISGKFLKRPWRWPELWGMNLKQIRDPHLIYPGQTLWLEVVNGRARLRAGRRISSGSSGTIQMQPRVRVEDMETQPIATIPMHLIEPFLSEPLIVDAETLNSAHWIVGSRDGRQILGTGDRIYARSGDGRALQYQEDEEANVYRVFRNAVPIKDPVTQEVLGYEGRFAGRARLVRAETVSSAEDGGKAGVPEAAGLDVIAAKEEIRTGDRLLPEPPHEIYNHVPHAPVNPVNGLVVSVYGDSVHYVGQNQIVTINKGTRDGVDHGTVLSLISTGQRIVDKTNGRKGEMVKLPDERNGLLYIFRPFERLSYGLVIEIRDPVKIGDRVEAPALFADTEAASDQSAEQPAPEQPQPAPAQPAASVQPAASK